ncbi:hypothetical protein DXT99_21595 [Pontibacter diazotrophicus]|uniref:DUF5723 domain-containing protein n=1 Tax=Pontibacter diazotrophicus TaxID=1400979 RepID=A0A3D8L6P6_9BACT|nr:DUF5723 family protein [Pontibacter diazotrophicus]RDV13090.1 hypothetical protein DXT99_21595 [Pontibacter diazotrophicus]
MNVNLYSFKFVLSVVLLAKALAPDTAQAQQLGIANSNYAGTNSLYTNPSAIADSRHGFYLNLFSAEAGVTNNYLSYDAPFSLYKAFKEELEITEEYLKEDLNGKPKFVTAGVDFKGPSFMLRLSPKHSVAFTSRVRGSFQATNLSENFAQLVNLYRESGDDFEGYKSEYEDLANQMAEDNTFNFNADVYSELGLSYARVLYEKENHFLKAGLTVKRLAGGYSAHLINENAKFKLEERPEAGTDNEEYVLAIDNIKMKYGYLDEDVYWDLENMETSDIMKMLAGRNSAGRGWGTDLGFTYEFRPEPEQYRSMMDGKEVVDQEKNKYKFRVAVALMDVGGITYDNPRYVNAFEADKSDKEVRLSDFEGNEDGEDIDEGDVERYADILYESLGITDADKKTSFRSGLPTTLNVNVDYKIAPHIYANATVIHNLRREGTIGMRQSSLLALTPRFEFKKFEAAFPVALQNGYSVLTMGAMVRFMNFFVGSDNIGGAFNLGNPYGANVYMGVSLLPILKRNKKDKDKDGVSNAKDNCKKVPGTWELMGCPPSVPATGTTTSLAPDSTGTAPASQQKQ